MPATIVPLSRQNKVGFFPLSGSVMNTDIFLYAFSVFCQAKRLKLEEFPIQLESGFIEGRQWLNTRRDELEWLFKNDTVTEYPFGTLPPFSGAPMIDESRQLFLVQTGSYLRGVHESISVLAPSVEQYLSETEPPNNYDRRDLIFRPDGSVNWIEARIAMRPFFHETFEPDGSVVANPFFEAFVDRTIERMKGKAEAQSPLSLQTLSLLWAFQHPPVKHIGVVSKFYGNKY